MANQLAKTKFCKHQLRGYCRYEDQCAYAHSADELLPKPNFMKTKICVSFLAGTCDNPNCTYAHGVKELVSSRSRQSSAISDTASQATASTGISPSQCSSMPAIAQLICQGRLASRNGAPSVRSGPSSVHSARRGSRSDIVSPQVSSAEFGEASIPASLQQAAQKAAEEAAKRVLMEAMAFKPPPQLQLPEQEPLALEQRRAPQSMLYDNPRPTLEQQQQWGLEPPPLAWQGEQPIRPPPNLVPQQPQQVMWGSQPWQGGSQRAGEAPRADPARQQQQLLQQLQQIHQKGWQQLSMGNGDDWSVMQTLLSEMLQVSINQEGADPDVQVEEQSSRAARFWSHLSERLCSSKHKASLAEGHCLLQCERQGLPLGSEQLVIFIFLKSPAWISLFPSLVRYCGDLAASKLRVQLGGQSASPGAIVGQS